jgi:hypothetical protein
MEAMARASGAQQHKQHSSSTTAYALTQASKAQQQSIGTASISTWRCKPVTEQDAEEEEERREQNREGEEEAMVLTSGAERRARPWRPRRHTPRARQRQARPSHGGATAPAPPRPSTAAPWHLEHRRRRDRHGTPRQATRDEGGETSRRRITNRRGGSEAPLNGGSDAPYLAGGDGRRWPEQFGEDDGDTGVARARDRVCERVKEKGSVRPTEPKCGSG